MAPTTAETSSSTGTKPAKRAGKQDRTPTVLDSDITKPQVTEPGDAPFDTTDPTERASSVSPDKATAAQAGHGSVNAVVPLPEPEKPSGEKRDDRWEEYESLGPSGKLVKVRHNLDTGETERS